MVYNHAASNNRRLWDSNRGIGDGVPTNDLLDGTVLVGEKLDLADGLAERLNLALHNDTVKTSSENIMGYLTCQDTQLRI